MSYHNRSYVPPPPHNSRENYDLNQRWNYDNRQQQRSDAQYYPKRPWYPDNFDNDKRPRYDNYQHDNYRAFDIRPSTSTAPHGMPWSVCRSNGPYDDRGSRSNYSNPRPEQRGHERDQFPSYPPRNHENLQRREYPSNDSFREKQKQPESAKVAEPQRPLIKERSAKPAAVEPRKKANLVQAKKPATPRLPRNFRENVTVISLGSTDISGGAIGKVTVLSAKRQQKERFYPVNRLPTGKFVTVNEGDRDCIAEPVVSKKKPDPPKVTVASTGKNTAIFSALPPVNGSKSHVVVPFGMFGSERGKASAHVGKNVCPQIDEMEADRRAILEMKREILESGDFAPSFDRSASIESSGFIDDVLVANNAPARSTESHNLVDSTNDNVSEPAPVQDCTQRLVRVKQEPLDVNSSPGNEVPDLAEGNDLVNLSEAKTLTAKLARIRNEIKNKGYQVQVLQREMDDLQDEYDAIVDNMMAHGGSSG